MWHIFELLNTKDLEASPAPDYTAVFDFGVYGEREVRFIKSTQSYLIIFDGIVFCPGLNGQNPLIKGNKCVMIDEDGKIYAGYWED